MERWPVPKFARGDGSGSLASSLNKIYICQLVLALLWISGPVLGWPWGRRPSALAHGGIENMALGLAEAG